MYCGQRGRSCGSDCSALPNVPRKGSDRSSKGLAFLERGPFRLSRNGECRFDPFRGTVFENGRAEEPDAAMALGADVFSRDFAQNLPKSHIVLKDFDCNVTSSRAILHKILIVLKDFDCRMIGFGRRSELAQTWTYLPTF